MWQGTTSADGKNGSWTFFEPGHTGKTEDYTYSTDASGVLTGTWYIYNSNGTLGEKIVIVNNPDTSGRVEDYSNGTVMSYKSVWAANGSGTWYTYNSTSGVQSGTGTWH
jgi:antitoxin component YwqK of YwqJK toxin-antitoxin module